MAIEQNSEKQFLPTAPAFAMCAVCDAQYAEGTRECTKCKSPLSSVRKCPNCSRVLSAKHERCLYCSMSFLVDQDNPPAAAKPVASTGVPAEDPAKKRRAILVSVAVFLIVMFLGLYTTMKKIERSGPEVAASSYVLRGAPLRLQPNANSGSSTTLDSGTVVSLTGLAVDSEGHRWYVLRPSGRQDAFLKVTDVAPPKVRLPELGSQMLRAWLLSLRDAELVPEADSAVTYFCAEFPSSPHCDELRWLAAEQFRSLGGKIDSADVINRSKRLYQTIVDSSGPSATAATKELAKLDTDSAEVSRRRAPRTRSNTPGSNASETNAREYALVNFAEVHVRVPELKGLGTSGQVRAPIAKEIRVNGKVAVPSNAACLLKVSEIGTTKQMQVQLTAIEFGNHHYNVTTAPQAIGSAGGTIIFPLESSLLIGK